MEPKAGRYTEQRYQEGRQRWRARVRRFGLLFISPFALAGIAVAFVERQEVSWIAGAVTGASIALWVCLRESLPRYVERWHDGTEGERNTEKELEPLEAAGWKVLHEVKAPCGNYDHIVLGSAGLFLLDSKVLEGAVQVKDGKPRLCRRLYPDDDESLAWVRRKVRGSAQALHLEIKGRTGERPWVKPVVVVWSEFSLGILDYDECLFIHGSKVREWLEGRSAVLDRARVERFATTLDAIANGDPVSRDASNRASTSNPDPAFSPRRV